MNKRVCLKVLKRNAEREQEQPLYHRDTLRRALTRYRRISRLERRHACTCGRQRYLPSDKKKPCTYCGKTETP